LIALFDCDDAHHEHIKAFLQKHPARLLTTWPVLTETCAILPAPCTQDLLIFVERGGASVVDLPGEVVTTIRSLMHKYADRPMDFADASLVALAALRKMDSILSLDAEFTVYRLPGKKRFNNPLTDAG
jgi:hypothetical protein